MTKRFLFLILIYLQASICFAQEKSFLDVPYFEIEVNEDSMIKPNEIIVDFSLDENNLKKFKSIDEVENLIYVVLTNYNINPTENLTIVGSNNLMQSKFLQKKETISKRNYEIKLDSIEKVKTVFRVLDSIGLIECNIQKMNCTYTKEILDRLQKKACANALKKANEFAKILGKQSGEIIYLHASNTDFEKVFQNQYWQMKRKRGEEGLSKKGWNYNDPQNGGFQVFEIEIKKVKLSTSMLFRFSIK
jgi:uncharacterized protein